MHRFEIIEHALVTEKIEHYVVSENIPISIKLTYILNKRNRKQIFKLKVILKYYKKARKKIRKIMKKLSKPISPFGTIQSV